MKEILYFSAPWCAPCRQLGPVIESLADQITYRKINVDEDTDLAAKYGVRNIPTLILVENGIAKGKLVGNQTDTSILNLYNG